MAEGGAVFLDEIGELPGETQIALLRVLQEHEFERVDGTESIRTNVRVIAANYSYALNKYARYSRTYSGVEDQVTKDQPESLQNYRSLNRSHLDTSSASSACTPCEIRRFAKLAIWIFY